MQAEAAGLQQMAADPKQDNEMLRLVAEEQKQLDLQVRSNPIMAH